MPDEKEIKKALTYAGELVKIQNQLSQMVSDLNNFLGGSIESTKPVLYDIPENIQLTIGRIQGIICDRQKLLYNSPALYDIICTNIGWVPTPTDEIAAIECPGSDLKPGDVFIPQYDIHHSGLIYSYHLALSRDDEQYTSVGWSENYGVCFPVPVKSHFDLVVYRVVLRKDYE
jgi:hypothetical protein